MTAFLTVRYDVLMSLLTASPARRPAGNRRLLTLLIVGVVSIMAVLGLTPAVSVAATPGASAAAAVTAGPWTVSAGPAPQLPVGLLAAVSCPSTTNCTAVGNRYDTIRPFAEHWDGTSWTLTYLPQPAGSPDDFLTGVSCPTTGFCVAVGQAGSQSGGIEEATSVVWVQNSTGWHLASLPAAFTVPGDDVGLKSVSCPTTTYCLAVGSIYSAMSTKDSSFHRAPAAVSWDGQTWTDQSVPWTGGYSGVFRGVSCSSATNCMGVGEYSFTVPGPRLPLEVTEAMGRRWSGTTWTATPGVQPLSLKSVLNAVSCYGPNSCVAVGASRIANTPMAETWNGRRWAQSKVVAPTGTQPLTGVSCTSSGTCVLVGSQLTGGVESPAAAVGAGVPWTVTGTPPSTGRWNAVACASATLCLAVGQNSDANANTSTVDAARWDGVGWSALSPVIPTGPGSSMPTGVSCAAAGTCVATGDFGVSEQNGAGWTIPSIAGLPTSGRLQAVSCLAGRPCVAVGSGGLIAARGTSGWAVQSSPATDHWSLRDVSCASATSCVAVGQRDAGSEYPEALSWNGTAWSATDLPYDGDAPEIFVNAVSCPSAGYCLAVGVSFDGYDQAPIAYTLVNGTWSRVLLPALSTQGNLAGVSCVSATRCTAVGAVVVGPGLLDRALVGTWTNGSISFSELPSTDANGQALSGLGRVSCTTTGCAATSETAYNLGVTSSPLMAVGSGSEWTVEPFPPGAVDSFSDVSCLATGCTAVGYGPPDPSSGVPYGPASLVATRTPLPAA